jgi:mono/diheme cytochrome c family protein
MAADQLYRAICIACHDADGRGTIVRKAMPTIPDLTDPKWHATRSDAELRHSIVEGKGQFMLPMKDKFALAHTEVNEMIAFMRSFQSGKQVVAGVPPAPAAGSPAPGPGPAVAGPVTAISTTTPSAPVAPVAAIDTAAPAAPTAPASTLPPTPGHPAVSSTADLGLTSPAPAPLPASPPMVPALVVSPERTTVTAPSPERAARLRAASEFYGVNCIACHGPDGRGSTVRVAMPLIPDFTNREWHMNRDNPQLAISILDGKGVLMPAWRGRVSPELAQDLTTFIRTFGPPGLALAAAPTTEIGTRFRQLRRQWQELDQQVQALSHP